MQEVLLTEGFGAGDMPVYEKDPGPAYVIDGPSFTCSFRLDGTKPPERETVVERRLPHRVHVPMSPLVELKRSPDELVFELVKHVAELGSWVDYGGGFDTIRAYFDAAQLPLAFVVKNPSLELQVPAGVEVIDEALMPAERFYCLTAAELLGRIPVKRRAKQVGSEDPDEHRLIQNPMSPEAWGFLIFNPRGILAAFV